jgi:hypothetical protein
MMARSRTSWVTSRQSLGGAPRQRIGIGGSAPHLCNLPQTVIAKVDDFEPCRTKLGLESSVFLSVR